jgi:hypothetical protein
MQEFLWKTYLESVAQPNVPIEQAVAQQAVVQQVVAPQAVAQQAAAQPAARLSTVAGINHFITFTIF